MVNDAKAAERENQRGGSGSGHVTNAFFARPNLTLPRVFA